MAARLKCSFWVGCPSGGEKPHLHYATQTSYAWARSDHLAKTLQIFAPDLFLTIETDEHAPDFLCSDTRLETMDLFSGGAAPVASAPH
jgi:hypothetical protein